jgi:NAD(P)H-hydrate epimerase
MHAILEQQQMKAWDEFTILTEPISSIDLMERAATVCSEWIKQKWNHTYQFVVLCGQGNNGGDGFAIARHLLQFKYEVCVYSLNHENRSSDNEENKRRFLEIPKARLETISTLSTIPKNAIVIDALFGNGLNRPLEGELVSIIEKINEQQAIVVSIDVPSGMMTDKFDSSATILQASFTLTFQCFKKAFLFPETGPYCGEIHCLDIGLHPDFPLLSNVALTMIDSKLVKEIYKPRSKFSHKGTYGHCLLIAGSQDKMGACILAAKACLGSGAGLLFCLLDEAQYAILQTALPEAMCASKAAFENMEFNNYQSIAIGPGIGLGENSMALMMYLIDHANKPIIIDADAISLLSQQKTLLASLPQNSILTPHPKEFDRLFGIHKNAWERYDTQVHLSKQYSIYILLKGTYSCLTTPDGLSYFNQTGNAGMAKGGSGDALTGIICGLFAQYKNMKVAAILGMYLHGLAGDFAASKHGQESMLTSNLIDELVSAFKTLAVE